MRALGHNHETLIRYTVSERALNS